MFNWIFKLFGSKEKEPEIAPEMKYLIVGLGNMGADYDDTRHNIGFEVIDLIAHQEGLSFKHDTLGDTAHFKHKGRTLYLLKPSTYMNRSGKAVKYWMGKHKIQVQNLLILVDDLNLDFGKIRLREKGSDGGHNGLKDIAAHFGNQNYPRLRIGIGDNFSKGRQVDFVLGKWNKKENQKLPDILQEASKAVKNFATIGAKFTKDKIKSH